MPEGTAVTIGREKLLELLVDESGPAVKEVGNEGSIDGVDLSVQQVAVLYGKSPNTIRRWLESRQLEGYKLFGKQWRISRGMLAAFQEDQRRAATEGGRANRRKPLDAWRAVQ